MAEQAAERSPRENGPALEVVPVLTNVDLHRYVVNLFRRDDSMCLYGIPYDMKPGQQPGDIWRAIRDAPYRSPANCWRMGLPYQALTLPPDGWIWLGSPSWWGSMSKEEREEAQRFLADLERMSPGIVPQGPFEWVALKGHPDLRAFHLEHGHVIS